MMRVVLIAVALMTLAGCGNGGETASGGGGVAGAAGATTGGAGGFAGDAAVGGASGAAGMGAASGQAGSAGGAGAGGASGQAGSAGGAGAGGASGQAGSAGGAGAAGCATFTTAQYRALGYEPVNAVEYGVTPNDDSDDDGPGIQRAIIAANVARRVVFFPPGKYKVESTLYVIQDKYQNLARPDNSDSRYGLVLQGSTCGTELPTIRLEDGVDARTDHAAIANKPTPLLMIYRFEGAAWPADGVDVPENEDPTDPTTQDGGRAWGLEVKNLHLVLGDNPGAVGIRMQGAEGSNLSNVKITATGAFAGVYDWPSSGGWSYRVEVVGGKYGLWADKIRGGAQPWMGLKLSQQTDTPIVLNGAYPFVLVGADITHDTGPVISARSGTNVTGSLSQSGINGSVSFVDSKVQVGSGPILRNTNKGLYFRNSHFKGTDTIVENTVSGGLLVAGNANAWTLVSEYGYAGTNYHSMIGGVVSHQSLLESVSSGHASVLTATTQQSPPADLASRHFYPDDLCNFERADVVWAHQAPYMANPDDDADDTSAIQSALDDAGPHGTVYLRAATADSKSQLVGSDYRTSGTLVVSEHRKLCGVAEYSTKIRADPGWQPVTDTPMVRTDDSATAAPGIVDIRLLYPRPTGSEVEGWDPVVYPVLWSAGRGVALALTYHQAQWGNPGPVRGYVVTEQGGGKLYGIPTQISSNPNDFLNNSSLARRFYIRSVNPLTIFPAHLQFNLSPYGAMLELDGAKNVSVFAIKNELASTPDKSALVVQSNPAESIPPIVRIRDSENVLLVGCEGLAPQGHGRGIIELDGTNSDVSVALVGSRNATLNPAAWFFVKEGAVGIPGDSFAAFFTSK